MSRCQHNHHRPWVKKSRRLGMWFARCECGWYRGAFGWRESLVFALAHSEALTS